MSARADRPGVLWEITGRWCLLSDTHVGAAQVVPRHAAQSDVDLHLDRDPRTGAPRLRATTLAGLLRHGLAARVGDPARASELFGAAEGDGRAPRTSAVEIDDAFGRLPEGTGVAVRTGTRVDPAAGTVLPGLLWQWEVLPAGTVFVVHLRLRVAVPADEARLLTLVALAVEGVGGAGPGTRVGGRTGRGHGSVRATHWAVRRLDLGDEHDWFAHHGRSWEERWRAGADALAEASADLSVALARELRAKDRAGTAAHLAARVAGPDRRRRAELRLALAVAERTDPLTAPSGDLRPGLLSIGDAPTGDRLGEVDRAHRERPVVEDPDKGEVRIAPVLGDTALFALVKRIAARSVRDAAEALGDADPGRRQAWYDHWWGADTGAREAVPRPSRVRLRTVPVITGGAVLTATRMTVDSLFGDAVDGRLFTDDLQCGGVAEVVFDIDDPDDAIRGLCALVVRDLATVPFDTVGAGAGVGHGRVSAVRAELVTLTGDRAPERVDLLDASFAPDGADAEVVRGWVAALRALLSPEPDREDGTSRGKGGGP
ncbi:RAMP superfamily CRISPR-associated protein [Nocardiopsis lambiniae]|uniref:RAMP superfamily CRISPR-associated protein n=1 Tax=Nocardiopsis lambiniae TaxID=3075539 RepID=A0ABU2MCN5_9ACTN|nr:RAMP superfamily CRISPR-associated protein [Nocardiopsis sp. DSM 44743]MDT0330367.1 RAMP superfamily CRISPR-associated protein [Nocardiopsis sp. DSM 44743]